MATKAALLLFAVACPAAAKQCPGELFGTPISDEAEIPTLQDYNAALKGLNIQAVVADIVHMLTKTQECWPADSSSTSAVGTSYGGLFTRLSWHCSGSYRNTDGRGGCSGGRQRFQPENSWDDNTNLDKARALLWPIKQKYGDALSWGDLFILAGTSSICTWVDLLMRSASGVWTTLTAAKAHLSDPALSSQPAPSRETARHPLAPRRWV